MKRIWFEYWGGMVDVKIQRNIPRGGRYLCSDFEDEGGFDYYDVNEDYIVAVPF